MLFEESKLTVNKTGEAKTIDIHTYCGVKWDNRKVKVMSPWLKGLAFNYDSKYFFDEPVFYS